MGKYRKSLFISFIISIIFLVDNVFAESIQNTCYSINQACSTRNRYTYSLYGSTDDFYTGTFGSRYSGKADYIVFDFDYDLLGNSTYMVSISASDIDFRNIRKSNTFVYQLVGSKPSDDCQPLGDPIQVTNVSFSQSKVVITIKTISTSSGFSVIFGSDGASEYITAVNTFGFTTVDITTVESNDTQNIIDNANQNSQAIIDNNKENTENIIDNNNSNTNSIIDNNDKNTQDIIDNQNKNNEELKESIDSGLNNCHPSINLLNFGTTTLVSGGITHTITNNTITSVGTAVSESSTIGNTSYFFTFDETLSAGTYTFSRTVVNGYRLYIRMYDENKSTYEQAQITANNKSVTFTLNSPKKYFYVFYAGWSPGSSINIKNVNLQLQKGNIATKYEPYGEEVCTSKLDDVNSGLNGINGSINNSDVDDDVGKGFFDDFSSEDFGLSDIITIPLNTITSLTSKSCQPLSIPIPKTGKNINLPCMTQIYEDKIGTIFTIWQVVSFGIIAYFIAIDIFHLVKGFKDPDSDKVEVLDL